MSDEAIEQVIAREVKKRRESATIYRANDRADLAENEEKEAEILQSYLPEQLSEAELREVVEAKITALGVVDSRGMGAVIGAVKSEVGNSADGAMIAQIVKQTLTK